jgi:hypothetical protein
LAPELLFLIFYIRGVLDNKKTYLIKIVEENYGTRNELRKLATVGRKSEPASEPAVPDLSASAPTESLLTADMAEH